MALMSINANGAKQLQLRLITAQDRIPARLETAMLDIGAELIIRLRQASPKGHEAGPPIGSDAPGRLADSYHARVTGGKSRIKLVVTSDEPTKLKIVRKGRKAVHAKNKKALYWKGAQHPVKSVKATRPNEFVFPTLTSAMPMMIQKLTEAMQEEIRLI